MTRPDGASDARLTELLRADTVTAYAALLELRARHQPSVLDYARLCTAGESAARQLAAQAFTLAARETGRGVDPGVPWRHRLLLLTARSAAAWAGDERAAGLDPSVLLLLNTAGPGGPVPPMLTAFESLPARTQGLVWYGLVEAEPEARTADHLGLTREDVVYGTEGALQSLARTCLRLRLAASDDSRCADFRRLIEESVRPDSPRASTDLHAHMVRCPHCTAAHEELCALRDTPRPALAEGLLPWGGTAYVGRSTAEPEARPRAGSRTRSGTWPRPRRLVLASAALGVALAPLLLFLVSQGGGSPTGASASVSASASASASGVLPGPPQVTVTTTVSPSLSPSASATSGPPSPSPTRSSAPPRKASPPPFRPPGGSYAQVVNVSTARCLDVAGDFDNGTDVVTAPCSSARSQRWRVDSDRGVLQSAADPDFCLDSRGDVDKGLGIWSCDSVEGDNSDNLRFTVDPDGVIRPAIAIATGMTPGGGDGVSLEPLTGGAEQRWRAGAT
ncbi:RICIN domain-containing protein [Streptomyces canus]|uniref:RICIN domain-containing protein n=1 Tax=Streptomyces canus TaxID=58343 RepID=UPI002E30924F|nr:RICIN domain-containing protein [Streptomyces canus]